MRLVRLCVLQIQFLYSPHCLTLSTIRCVCALSFIVDPERNDNTLRSTFGATTQPSLSSCHPFFSCHECTQLIRLLRARTSFLDFLFHSNHSAPSLPCYLYIHLARSLHTIGNSIFIFRSTFIDTPAQQRRISAETRRTRFQIERDRINISHSSFHPFSTCVFRSASNVITPKHARHSSSPFIDFGRAHLQRRWHIKAERFVRQQHRIETWHEDARPIFQLIGNGNQ